MCLLSPVGKQHVDRETRSTDFRVDAVAQYGLTDIYRGYTAYDLRFCTTSSLFL